MTWAVDNSIRSRSVTNTAWVKNGVLAPYTDGAVGIYKCPADKYLSPQQKAAGWKQRLRSMSMNAMFGLSNNDPNSPQSRGQSWGYRGQYRQFIRTTQVPQPSMTWLTLDEQPDSINDAFFITDLTSHWTDRPATYHNRATGFSFVDGHAEIHKWQSDTSIYPVQYSYVAGKNFDAAGKLDIQWYIDRLQLIPYK